MRIFIQRMWRATDTPVAIALGRYSTMALSLLTVPVIARVLEPAGRGASATVLSAIAVTTIVVGLGVPLACRRRAASGQRVEDVVRGGRVFALLTILPALAISAVLHFAIFRSLPSVDLIALYVSMALVPLSVSWAIDVSMLIAMKRYRRMALLGIFNASAYFILVLSGWLGGFLSVAVVIYAQLLSNVVTFLVGLAWTPMKGGRVTDFWGMAREGLSLTGGQLAEIASKRLDQLIVFPLIGASGAGQYSIASTVSQVPVPIAQSLGVTAFTQINREISDLRQRVVDILRNSFALGVMAVGVIALLAPILIPWIFGVEYEPSIILVWVLLIGVLGNVIGYNGAMILAALKRGKDMTIAQLVGAAVGIAAAVILANLFGAVGAASGIAIGGVTTAVVVVYRLNVGPIEILPRPRDFPQSIMALLKRD